ncbi:hypothetical protein EVAR_102702_1 [Eumeta japonica]|uniref:Uncharacterized protein n=1 Tax=Eumeta variegata TaxID=151549 RepID=A0A4C1TIV8_EUMVA|nr:hypothetical protein EVAR_102702_1 [Eumeta japonica]
MSDAGTSKPLMSSPCQPAVRRAPTAAGGPSWCGDGETWLVYLLAKDRQVERRRIKFRRFSYRKRHVICKLILSNLGVNTFWRKGELADPRRPPDNLPAYLHRKIHRRYLSIDASLENNITIDHGDAAMYDGSMRPAGELGAHKATRLGAFIVAKPKTGARGRDVTAGNYKRRRLDYGSARNFSDILRSLYGRTQKEQEEEEKKEEPKSITRLFCLLSAVANSTCRTPALCVTYVTGGPHRETRTRIVNLTRTRRPLPPNLDFQMSASLAART